MEAHLQDDAQGNLSVFDALVTRRAIRAFLPTAVSRNAVERILTAAARAPSGSNTQPWKVHVLAGKARDKFCTRLMHAFNTHEPGHGDEYQYYPEQWFEPYQARRRKLGFDLYASTGIARNNHEARHAQLGRNYNFFDAPVGMIFSIDRRHGMSAWIDLGGFLQSIMLAARGLGLHTCPQQAFAYFHCITRNMLNLPENDIVVCGMALGYADPNASVNCFDVEREPLDKFASFHWDSCT